MREFWVTLGSAAIAWLVVDLPVMIAAPAGWARFYQLSDTRSADWGSIWYFFETEHWPLVGTTSVSTINVVSAGVFLVACVLIVLLALGAPRRPRVAQLFFLTLATFLLSNKVWSPQYVVWLAPLVVLARPRWGAYLLWQVAEVGYFFAIWAYLITVSVAGPSFIGGRRHRHRAVLRRAHRPVRRHTAAVRSGGAGHPAARARRGAGGRGRRPCGRRAVRGPRPRPAQTRPAPQRPARRRRVRPLSPASGRCRNRQINVAL